MSTTSEHSIGWTATDISQAVREGRVQARDVVAESLSRIERYDRTLGAFQIVRADKALAEADAVQARSDLAELPLAGVPVAIKDNVAVTGEPMRNGSHATDARPQDHDHPVVARLREAGAIVVGITRVPELCLFSVTDSGFGITRNPWNPARTAGGSSGGAGAAVASGMVPIAHGNDGLGSVRIPAAACGLVGIKPGFGVVPADLGVDDWYHMSENGVLATTAADAALGLAVMADRPEFGHPTSPSRLAVAVSAKSPLIGAKADSSFVRAMNQVATLLARAGHEVHNEDPHYATVAALAGVARWFGAAANELDELPSKDVEHRVATHARLGRLTRRTPLVEDRMFRKFREEAAEFLTGFDVLVTPALASPPVPAIGWSKRSWLRTMNSTVRWTPYAAPWNLAGFPAISVPLPDVHPDSGTPLGVQLVGRPGQEALLLSVAAQIEAMSPWTRITPGYADGLEVGSA